MSRPHLDTTISLADFDDYYWLKEELVAFCRSVGLPRAGGKLGLYLSAKPLLDFRSYGSGCWVVRHSLQPHRLLLL